MAIWVNNVSWAHKSGSTTFKLLSRQQKRFTLVHLFFFVPIACKYNRVVGWGNKETTISTLTTSISENRNAQSARQWTWKREWWRRGERGEQGERQQEYFYKKRDKAIKIAFKIISILAIMLACTCYFMAFLLCTYLMNAIHKESTQNILHTNSHIDIENLFPLWKDIYAKAVTIHILEIGRFFLDAVASRSKGVCIIFKLKRVDCWLESNRLRVVVLNQQCSIGL